VRTSTLEGALARKGLYITVHIVLHNMPEDISVYVRTRRVGGSLVITLPHEVVDLIGVREKEVLRVTVARPRRSFFGAFRGVGTYSHRERADHRD